MLVKNKIVGNAFEHLIEHAFQKSDVIMYIFRKDGFNKSKITVLNKNLENLKRMVKWYSC